MTAPKVPKSNWKQVNYRLDPDTIAYIHRWHEATNKDKEIIVNHMIQSYKEVVGEPPQPLSMPAMKPRRKSKKP